MNDRLRTDIAIELRVIWTRRSWFVLLMAALIAWLTILLAQNWKAAIVFGLAVLALAPWELRLKGPWLRGVLSILGLAVGAAAILFLSQMVQNENLSQLKPGFLMLGLACSLMLELLLLTLCGNVPIAMGAGILLTLTAATANYYVYSFRGVELQPMDLLYAQIALSVSGNYRFSVAPFQVYGWSLGVLLLLAMGNVKAQTSNPWRSGIWTRCISGVLSLGLVTALWTCSGQVELQSWRNNGTRMNGFLTGFCLRCFQMDNSAPEGYALEYIRELEACYGNRTAQLPEEPVNIIVIMNEAFADLGVYGSQLPDVMPCFRGLQENTIRGFALASIYGGKTPNSEYEVLTGYSMAFLNNAAVPFQTHIRQPVHSMVSLLSGLGYECVSMHPYHADGWMRSQVYPNLGFGKSLFLEDFPQQQMLRDYVSDQELYEQLVMELEQEREGPLFLWAVSMQNHGGYDYEGEDFEETVKLPGQGPEAVEQYLTLIQASDRALSGLIDYISTVEKPTVLLFYGDHQPGLDTAFLEALYGEALDTLDERQLTYMVPFLIWANYDLQEQVVELTSLNYLSGMLLEAAGIPRDPYRVFLEELRQIVPAINANGYYSNACKCFLPLEEAAGAERDWLNRYAQLQYNSLSGGEDTSEVFFPMPEEKG